MGAESATADHALALLNRLRAVFGAGELVHDNHDPLLQAELRAAYPLLAMLVPQASPESDDETLAEVRHYWNKAVRRRDWQRLPPLPAGGQDASPDRATQSAAVARFLEMFGIGWDSAACSDNTLRAAASLSQLLHERLERLRTPPLPSPADYARELTAIQQAWNALAESAPGLPRLE